MIKIDQTVAQDILNGMMGLSGTLAPSQGTVLTTLVNQMVRAFVPVEEPAPAGAGNAPADPPPAAT